MTPPPKSKFLSRVKKVERPVPLDGISLLPLLDGRMKTRPQAIGFWQFAGNQKNLTPDSGPSAWSDNQYKLVKTKAGQWELYDLVADRAEKHDISEQHPEILNRMKSELAKWHISVIDSYHGHDYPQKKVIQPPKPQRSTL